MLAPVLARLNDIPGLAESRVDSSGRFFRIEVRDDHDPRVAEDAIRGVLGADTRLLRDDEAAQQLAAALRGDPWVSESTVMTLSYVEARILAVRIAAAATEELRAVAAVRDALAEAIRVELFETMERVHRAGGRPDRGWIYAAWPEIAHAVVARCAPSLPPGLEHDLAACLPRLLTR